MRLLSLAVLLVASLAAPAIAASDLSATALGGCAGSAANITPAATAPYTQLAQSSCRSSCQSKRGYCLSTCSDSQCRANCRGAYQSCISGCR